MATTLGAMHMSNERNYEVQRTNHFEVIFEGLSEDITLAVSSCSLPTISQDPISLSFGNSDVKVAGKLSFDDVSLVVKDFIVADIERQCYEWRRQVGDPETMKVGWASDYKRNGRLYQYGPDGTCVRTWRLKGCWPTSMQMSDGSYDGSDKKEITLPISVDLAYPER